MSIFADKFIFQGAYMFLMRETAMAHMMVPIHAFRIRHEICRAKNGARNLPPILSEKNHMNDAQKAPAPK